MLELGVAMLHTCISDALQVRVKAVVARSFIDAMAGMLPCCVAVPCCMLQQRCSSNALQVRVDAVVALRSFIDAFDSDGLQQVKPLIPQLLDVFFQLMQEVSASKICPTHDTTSLCCSDLSCHCLSQHDISLRHSPGVYVPLRVPMNVFDALRSAQWAVANLSLSMSTDPLFWSVQKTKSM